MYPATHVVEDQLIPALSWKYNLFEIGTFHNASDSRFFTLIASAISESLVEMVLLAVYYCIYTMRSDGGCNVTEQRPQLQ